MKLMIVESPNKVKKIKEILGAGWDVAASVGHIRDLPVKTLGIAMPGYQPQYELNERGADVVKTLRTRAAKADQVYLATDPDREGEAIAWHVAEALKLRKPQRVSFDAITPEVVLQALKQPRQIDLHLVHAQEARRVLDRLVGYQVSPVLSRQAARSGLSAGRVQSPAVRLVVDREREIEVFVEVRHFGAELSFDSNSWRAQWETGPYLKKSAADPEGKYILDEALATRAAACRACTVLASSNRIVKQPPPPPFTTSTMLQAASIRLRWKPDQTAQVAQRLFEAGLITYHRTDSQNFSKEAVKEVRGYAAGRGLPLPPAGRTWRARGNAQEAHEAIRPTHFATEHAGDDAAQQQLYTLIWQRAVASQLADAEWSVNTTRLEATSGAKAKSGAKNGGETFTFKAEGRVLAVQGWKALTAKDDADEDDDGADGESGGKVPVLAVGAAVRAESGKVLNKKTLPPPRYSQAGLIKKLENIGIGRPSTYPAILKNVQTRGYLEDDKKYLRPTELGLLVVDTLMKRFSFLEFAFTRDLEQQLDEIAEGRAEYLAVVSAADERLQGELRALRAVPRAAAESGAEPAWGRSTGANAPVWRVGSTPAHAPKGTSRAAATLAAPTSVALPPGKKRAPARTRAESGKQPDAVRVAKSAAVGKGKPVVKKSAGAKKTAAPAVKTTAPPCPVCKAGFVRLANDEAKFYGCSAFADRGCQFKIWRAVAGRSLSEADVLALCRDGKTGKLGGFTSKVGKPFEAALVLSGEGKVEFLFR